MEESGGFYEYEPQTPGKNCWKNRHFRDDSRCGVEHGLRYSV